MFVSLFTSRVILNSLGVVDYGLNNVIAGVTGLFTFLNGSLSASTSRFLTFELGTGNSADLRKVFQTALNIHSGFAVVVIILCETAGLWIVNHVLNIPEDRLFACNVIYQYVIITAILSVTQVPLNAMIISHERMNVYAYLGISDAVLKLGIAYIIFISPYDKLITLGSLHLLISVGMYLFYHIYCKRHFSEYSFSIKTDKPTFKKMIGFSTWSLLGSSATMLKNQGINILINIFFGPVVNAANAIAYQVNHAITSFSQNFTVALNPQIIKSYAAGERGQMKQLIFRGGKFSFFLFLFFFIPVFLETEYILTLWLSNVPEYTINFVRLILVLSLIESFSFTIGTALKATGNIKYVQIVVSFIILLNFPLTFLFYNLGYAPSITLIISSILSLAALLSRLHFLKMYLDIQIIEYMQKVFLPCFLVSCFSFGFVIIGHILIPSGLIKLIIIFISSIIFNTAFVFIWGLTNHERAVIKTIIYNKLKYNCGNIWKKLHY